MMYIRTAGAQSMQSMCRAEEGEIKWKFDPGVDRAWAGDVACCGVNNRGVALWKDKVISIALDGRIFALNAPPAKSYGSARRRTGHRRDRDARPLVVRDLAIIGSAGGEFGIRAGSTRRPQHRPAGLAHLHHPGRRRTRQ